MGTHIQYFTLDAQPEIQILKWLYLVSLLRYLPSPDQIFI